MSTPPEEDNICKLFIEETRTNNTGRNGSTNVKRKSWRIRRLTTRLKSRFKARPKSVAKTYADSFTINGLTKIATGQKWERILWLIVLTIALSIVAYTVSKSIAEYRRYDVRTEIRVVDSKEINLPDLFICDEDIYTLNSGLFCHNGTHFGNDESSRCNKRLDLQIAVHKPDWFRLSNITSNPILHPDVCTRVKLKGVKNYVWARNSTVKQQRVRKLFLFFVDPNTIDLWNSVMSIQIVDNILPGKYIINVYDHQVYERLPAPYPSNCTNGDDFVFPGGYARDKCAWGKIFKRMLAECGTVVDPWLPFVKPSYKRGDIKNFYDTIECLREIILYSDPIHECQISCKEESYKVREMLLDNYETTKWDLNIRYVKNRTTIIREIPSYTIDMVLADVGGYLGLFVGMSILSLIEIVVYIAVSTKEKYYGV